MGNCLRTSEKLTAEIVPHDRATVYPAVRLHGSPESILAAYIRFALLHNSVSTDFNPSAGTLPAAAPTSSAAPTATAARRRVPDRADPEIPVTLQAGSEVVSGSRDALLRFIDARFPGLSPPPPPPLLAPPAARKEEETTSLMVRVTRLQHKSMTWHLERMARWVEDLAKRGGRKAIDPKVGSWRMEVRKFGRSYSQLLEVMMEHAQMEERVLFPIFDSADRGKKKDFFYGLIELFLLKLI